MVLNSQPLYYLHYLGVHPRYRSSVLSDLDSWSRFVAYPHDLGPPGRAISFADCGKDA
jgi:hypothetical protein